MASPAPARDVFLNIEGMTCASCAASVSATLRAQPGVLSADINLATEQAHLRVSGIQSMEDDIESGRAVSTVEKLCAAVKAIGYEATEHKREKSHAFEAAQPRAPHHAQEQQMVLLQIGGMTCASCAGSVSAALEAHAAVAQASVNLTTEVATILVQNGADASPALTASLVAAVEGIGFEARPIRLPAAIRAQQAQTAAKGGVETIAQKRARLLHPAAPTDEDAGDSAVLSLGARQSALVMDWRRRCIIAGAFALPNLVLTMLLPYISVRVREVLQEDAFGISGLSWSAVAGASLATPVQFLSAWPFYIKAFKAARNCTFGMDFLVVVGTSGEYKHASSIRLTGVACLVCTLCLLAIACLVFHIRTKHFCLDVQLRTWLQSSMSR